MTGATATTDGADGECIGPQAGDEDKYWTGAARWESDTSKLITNFTSSDNASDTGIITSSGGDTAMSAMTSGDTHGGLFGGLSKAVLNARKLINTVKRIWQTVANAWVSGTSYSVGQVVTYINGHTYICKAAHTSSASITPGNTTYWDDKTIGDMIYSLNSNYANTRWKYLGAVTGKNTLALPNNYTELYLSIYGRISVNSIFVTFVLLKGTVDSIISTGRYVCCGLGLTPSADLVNIMANSNGIRMEHVRIENTEYVTDSQMKVYYR
jgi:hypothetical protein